MSSRRPAATRPSVESLTVAKYLSTSIISCFFFGSAIVAEGVSRTFLSRLR